MKKYYSKYNNGNWKVYLQRFANKQTGQFLFIKPGITEFKDANARLYFNDLLEEISFKDYFKTKCIKTLICPSKEIAENLEKILLKHFGNQLSEKELGFKTPGWTEVRRYNQNKINEAFEIINKFEQNYVTKLNIRS
jgi:hypothetical protein